MAETKAADHKLVLVNQRRLDVTAYPGWKVLIPKKSY